MMAKCTPWLLKGWEQAGTTSLPPPKPCGLSIVSTGNIYYFAKNLVHNKILVYQWSTTQKKKK